jgi:hypothetical protein
VSSPGPRLVGAAPADDDRAPAPTPPPAPSENARRIRTPWLLAGLLALALLLLAVQTGRVGGLTSQVEGLTGELAAAHGTLAAFEARFERIRGAVGEIRSRVDELEALSTSPPGGEIPVSEAQ